MSFSEGTDDEDDRGSPVIPLAGFINSMGKSTINHVNDRNNNTDSDIGHLVQSVVSKQLAPAVNKMRPKTKEIVSTDSSSEDSDQSADNISSQKITKSEKHVVSKKVTSAVSKMRPKTGISKEIVTSDSSSEDSNQRVANISRQKITKNEKHAVNKQLTPKVNKMGSKKDISKEIVSTDSSSEDDDRAVDDISRQNITNNKQQKRRLSQPEHAQEAPPAKKRKKHAKNAKSSSESDELFWSSVSDDIETGTDEPESQTPQKSSRMPVKSLSLRKTQSLADTPRVSKVLPYTSTPKDKPSAEHVPNTGLPMRFECPDKYRQIELVTDTGATVEDMEDDDIELWLCKVPLNMDLDILNGQKIDLAEPTVIKKEKKNNCVKMTEIHFQRHENSQDSSSMTVLAPSKDDHFLHPVCKDIQGMLTVRECPEPSPYIMPAHRPKVKRELPSGLRQRYFPFGSDAPALNTTSTKHKKKKSKKNKRKS